MIPSHVPFEQLLPRWHRVCLPHFLILQVQEQEEGLHQVQQEVAGWDGEEAAGQGFLSDEEILFSNQGYCSLSGKPTSLHLNPKHNPVSSCIDEEKCPRAAKSQLWLWHSDLWRAKAEGAVSNSSLKILLLLRAELGCSLKLCCWQRVIWRSVEIPSLPLTCFSFKTEIKIKTCP